MTMVSTIFTSNRDLCTPILSSDTNCCESASYAINCEISKRSSSTHEESQHTQGLTWFGRLPTSTGKGESFLPLLKRKYMIQCYWISFIAQESMRVYNS